MFQILAVESPDLSKIFHNFINVSKCGREIRQVMNYKITDIAFVDLNHCFSNLNKFPFFFFFLINGETAIIKKKYNFHNSTLTIFKNYILKKSSFFFIHFAKKKICTFLDFLKQIFKYPDASRSLVGFHAHMKTSDSCPRKTVALFVGISCPTSTSMASVWFAEIMKKNYVPWSLCISIKFIILK